MREKVFLIKLVESSSGSEFCIDFDEVKRRTKHMISYDKNISVSKVSLFHSLSGNLMYTGRDKISLKPLIDKVFFSDVNAIAIPTLLAQAITVRDLAGMIYRNFIPENNRC